MCESADKEISADSTKSSKPSSSFQKFKTFSAVQGIVLCIRFVYILLHVVFRCKINGTISWKRKQWQVRYTSGL